MTISKQITTILTFAALALIGTAGTPARASLSPDNPVVTAAGSNFTYTYDAALSSSEKTVSGDFLTITGIDDYVSGSAFSSPLFTSTVTTTGGLTDITWTATGTKNGAANLDFGFDSTTNTLGFGSYSFKDQSKTGSVLTGTGTVQVPAAITPEPSSVVSLGLCALVVVCFMLMKRIRRTTARGDALEAFA